MFFLKFFFMQKLKNENFKIKTTYIFAFLTLRSATPIHFLEIIFEKNGYMISEKINF